MKKIVLIVIVFFISSSCDNNLSGVYVLNSDSSHKIEIKMAKKKYYYSINNVVVNSGDLEMKDGKISFYKFIFYEDCRGGVQIGKRYVLMASCYNGKITISPDDPSCDFEKP